MKSDRSTHWCVRVTAPWEHIELKYKELREWIDYVDSAIGYHIGTKSSKKQPHAHIVLNMRTELQKQSLDTRMKKLFDVKGVNYSSKIWDCDKKALSYLYHDKVGKVEINMEMSEELKTEISNLVKVYDEIVTTAKAKASYKCVDFILEEIKESERLWKPREILRRMLMGVRRGQWHPMGSMTDRYLDEILIKQGNDDDAEAVYDHMIDKFMARYEKY